MIQLSYWSILFLDSFNVKRSEWPSLRSRRKVSNFCGIPLIYLKYLRIAFYWAPVWPPPQIWLRLCFFHRTKFVLSELLDDFFFQLYILQICRNLSLLWRETYDKVLTPLVNYCLNIHPVAYSSLLKICRQFCYNFQKIIQIWDL